MYNDLSMNIDISMYKFLLNNNVNTISPDNIICKFYENEKEIIPIINNDLFIKLKNCKLKIDEYENKWNVYKKYTNPYEYIHTNIPYINKSVSSYRSLSRSYYKIIEIYNDFNINKILNYKQIKVFSLCESPGGFIEAIVNLRNNNTNDKYYTMSLINQNENDNIPSWNNNFMLLNKNKNIYIENGYDNTGNIINTLNFDNCVKKYFHSMDLITGDGGFDFSLDFNKQEINMVNLLFSQISYAIFMQKKNGIFILKIFDFFLSSTIDLIFLLTNFYEKVYITKPLTSRCANSEKYIVCINFIFNKHYIKKYYNNFKNIFYIINKSINSNKYVCNFLNISLPIDFFNLLENLNSIFINNQSSCIENTLNTIFLYKNKINKFLFKFYHNKYDKKLLKIYCKKSNDNSYIETLICYNIIKCIKWCEKYNVHTIIEFIN